MRANRLLTASVLGFITARDMTVMRRCNNWVPPRWIQRWMVCATRAGDGWLWYITGLAVLVVGGADRFRALSAAAVAATVGIWMFLVLKRAAGRPRPCTVAPHAWATLLPPDQFSFPSGHTMTAFAVATPLAVYYPAFAAALAFCAASVGGSRILLGMHYLSDVVAGAALGVLLGLASVAAFGG